MFYMHFKFFKINFKLSNFKRIYLKQKARQNKNILRQINTENKYKLQHTHHTSRAPTVMST